MSIQVGGIISGLETESLIEKLMEIEKGPITAIEKKQEAFTVQLSAYGELKTKLEALDTALDGLDDAWDFSVYSTASSDSDMFTASAGISGIPGSYDITVTQLATSHKIKSGPFSMDETVGAGTLHLEIGSTFTIGENNNKINFREDAGGGLGAELTATIASGTYTIDQIETAVQTAMGTASAAAGNSVAYAVAFDPATQKFSIEDSGATLTELQLLWATGTNAASSASATLGFVATDDTGATGHTGDNEVGNVVDIAVSATDTLDDVADAINDSTARISARVVYDGTNYVLSLSAEDTGKNNIINLTATDDDGNGIDMAGLSRLVYDAGVTTNMTQTQAAQNAIFQLDGIGGIQRSTNTISDVITGVTLTLKKAHSDPLTEKDTLTVSRDTNAIAAKINAFVDAYNGLLDFFSDYQHKYDEETEETGALFGDSTTNQIRSVLRDKLSDTLSGITSLSRLSDLGISIDTTKTEPKLKVDSSKLSSELNDHFEDVKTFFTRTTSGAEGFAVSTMNTLDTFLDRFDGTLTARQTGITKSVGKLEVKKLALEERLETTETQLWKRFNNLELLLSQFKNTGDYLTQQLASLQSLSNS